MTPPGHTPPPGFGTRIRTWRQLNGVKQSALAHMLGVSQPAVSRWERGLDMPEPQRLAQIRSLMAGSTRDEATLQTLFVSRQSAVRALIDYDTMSMVAVSDGFRAFWPGTSALIDVPLRDRLVAEANLIGNGAQFRRAVTEGSIGLISGVSVRQTTLQTDDAVPHRWHICFRRYGAQLYADMVFEPSSGDGAPGISDVVYLDAIMSGTPPSA